MDRCSNSVVSYLWNFRHCRHCGTAGHPSDWDPSNSSTFVRPRLPDDWYSVSMTSLPSIAKQGTGIAQTGYTCYTYPKPKNTMIAYKHTIIWLLIQSEFPIGRRLDLHLCWLTHVKSPQKHHSLKICRFGGFHFHISHRYTSKRMDHGSWNIHWIMEHPWNILWSNWVCLKMLGYNLPNDS